MWENSNETHLKLPQKTSHMEGVTSHGRCDLVSLFDTSLNYIYTYSLCHMEGVTLFCTLVPLI